MFETFGILITVSLQALFPSVLCHEHNYFFHSECPVTPSDHPGPLELFAHAVPFPYLLFFSFFPCVWFIGEFMISTDELRDLP